MISYPLSIAQIGCDRFFAPVQFSTVIPIVVLLNSHCTQPHMLSRSDICCISHQKGLQMMLGWIEMMLAVSKRSKGLKYKELT